MVNLWTSYYLYHNETVSLVSTGKLCMLILWELAHMSFHKCWNLKLALLTYNGILVYGQYLTLNDWSRGEQWILKSRETLRFEGNNIHCSPRDQSLSDLLHSKTKQKQNLKTALRFQRSLATAVNISAGNSELFPVWRHSFRNVARLWHLAGNSFIVRCHVTMN